MHACTYTTGAAGAAIAGRAGVAAPGVRRPLRRPGRASIGGISPGPRSAHSSSPRIPVLTPNISCVYVCVLI
jgi:hypothetical protein